MATTNELLTNEETRQFLAEEIPGFMAALASALGMTCVDLCKALEEGRLTKMQVIAALARHAIDLTAQVGQFEESLIDRTGTVEELKAFRARN
jgi:hypothetical protein